MLVGYALFWCLSQFLFFCVSLYGLCRSPELLRLPGNYVEDHYHTWHHSLVYTMLLSVWQLLVQLQRVTAIMGKQQGRRFSPMTSLFLSPIAVSAGVSNRNSLHWSLNLTSHLLEGLQERTTQILAN